MAGVNHISESGREKGSPPGNGLSLRFVGHAIAHHPVVVLLVVLTAAAGAGAAYLFLPLPKRTGAVVYRVAAQPPAVVTPVTESKVELATYKTMQAGLIKQRLVLMGALKELDVGSLPTLRREPEPLAYLEQKIQVDTKSSPELMRVSLEGDEEGELIKILTAVDTVYRREIDQFENGARDRRRKILDQRLERYDEMLKGYQGDLGRFANMLNSTSPAVVAHVEDLNKLRLQQLQADLVRAERDLEQAEAERKQAELNQQAAKDKAPPEARVDQALRADDGVVAREKALAERRAALADLEDQIRDKAHPRLAAARREVDEAKADLDKYRGDRRQAVTESVKASTAEEFALAAARAAERAAGFRRTRETVNKAFEDVKTELRNQSQTYLYLENTKQEIARVQHLRDQITHEIDMLDLERGAPSRVTKIEEPYVMSGLEGSRRLKTSLMAAGGILLAGFAGLVFWETRNRRVLAVDDVGRALGMKVFGTVPRVRAAEKATPDHEAALTEAVDTARTMLLYGEHAARPPKTVLVTSATPGEGKTSLAGHLAVSLTRAGYQTVLVDADLRNPSAHALFGAPAGPGLCEFLRGEADGLALARPTDVPRLSVLPAGKWTLAATQALAGGRWAKLRAALEAAFDFVVIDSSPVLPVVDALLLARNVDGVLLSVLHRQSKVASVAESQHRLLSIGANLMGVVLNGIEPKGGRYGYVPADPAHDTTANAVSA